MIGKFWRIFLLYRAGHREVTYRPRPLVGPGPQTGWIDRATLRNGTLTIEGWTTAESVALRIGPRLVAIRSRPQRADLPRHLGGRGFWASHDRVSGALALRLGDGTSYTDFPLGRPRLHQRLRAEGRILAAFLRDGARAFPHAVRFLRHRSLSDRARVRAALRLDPPSHARQIDGRVLSPAAPIDGCPAVTVIMPVYGAAELTAEALRRLAAHTGGPWRAIVIDDASPDPEIWPMLSAWAEDQGARVTLSRNPENEGFTKTVNRALSLADPAHPVVILNSDAMLPPDWAPRLLAPLADPTVASVTPLSNDAEICTVPAPGHPTDLRAGEAETMDAIAGSLGGDCHEVPTGVGFCMAIAPSWLDRVPRFDPVFGRGYGEEVDWCQRTRALGARHLVQHRLFVEHRSSASFGKEVRDARVIEASRIIDSRYPRFAAQVQEFIAQDPLATARMALTIARLSRQSRRVPLYLAHSMGGGAEMVLRRRLSGGAPALVLRVGGPVRWRLELHDANRVSALSTDRIEEVVGLLGHSPRRVIYCCGVGDPDPVELPATILSLARGHPVEIEVHDYFIVSPSAFLLDSEGRYRGVPMPRDHDAADRSIRLDGSTVSLADWRRAWGAVVDRASVVRVFSRDSAKLIATAYPRADAKLEISPHRPLVAPEPVAPPDSGALVVGVLGNISPPKGAALLCTLASEAARRDGLSFVLFGGLDPAHAPPPRLRVLGGYEADEIAALARRHRVSAWLMPSVCPETHSFATHEALATGLPVVGLALGAQGEALSAATNGHAVPLQAGRPDVGAILDALENVVAGYRSRSRAA